MPLAKYIFRPGINREGTNYSNEGGWYSADKVRFRKGKPERMAGWEKNTVNTIKFIMYKFICTNSCRHITTK